MKFRKLCLTVLSAVAMCATACALDQNPNPAPTSSSDYSSSLEEISSQGPSDESVLLETYRAFTKYSGDLSYEEWLLAVHEAGPDVDYIRRGYGAPSQGLGIDWDSYIDKTNWDYWVKVNGDWYLVGNVRAIIYYHVVSFFTETTPYLYRVVRDGRTVERPADPKRVGYTFDGWYRTGSSEKWDFTYGIVSADFSLYGYFQAKSSSSQEPATSSSSPSSSQQPTSSHVPSSSTAYPTSSQEDVWRVEISNGKDISGTTWDVDVWIALSLDITLNGEWMEPYDLWQEGLLTIKSSQPNVVEIEEGLNLRTVSGGRAKITVEIGGDSDFVWVTVQQKADEWAVTIANAPELHGSDWVIGEVHTIQVNVTCNGIYQDTQSLYNQGRLSIVSANIYVVSVTGFNLQAVGVGTAKITVSVGDGARAAYTTIWINVVEPTPDEWGVTIANALALSDNDWYIGDEKTLVLNVTCNGISQDANALINTGLLHIDSSDSSVVSVKGFNLTALAIGSAQITVTVHGVSDTVWINVVEPELWSISSLPNESAVMVQGIVTAQFNRSYMIEDETGAVLVYAQLPPAVAVGTYVKLCGRTSFYHTTIREINVVTSIDILSGEGPDTPVRDNPVALSGEQFASDVANIVTGTDDAALSTVPAKWNTQFQYVTLHGTAFFMNGYPCFYPEDLEAAHYIQLSDFGGYVEAGTAYDLEGYLSWDANFGYAALYVSAINVGPAVISSISLSAPTTTLSITNYNPHPTVGLTANLVGENTQFADLFWFSYDETIATVDEYGLVTAQGVGEVVIACSCGDLQDSVTITVQESNVYVSGIDVSPGWVSGYIGQTIQLSATLIWSEEGEFEGIRNGWTSENTSVATVDDNGLVTLVGTGQTRIQFVGGPGIDGGSVVGYAAVFCLGAVDYGSDSEPISVTTLLREAELIVPLNPDSYVFSEDIVTVKGIAKNVQFSTQYNNYNFDLVDPNNSTSSIKVTGALLDENIARICENDVVVVQDYLEAAKTSWNFYRGSKLGNPNVISREAGVSSITVNSAHATVNGVPETMQNDETLEFTVTPDGGYHVTSVTVNGIEIGVGANGKYSTMIEGDTQIVVTCQPDEGSSEPVAPNYYDLTIDMTLTGWHEYDFTFPYVILTHDGVTETITDGIVQDPNTPSHFTLDLGTLPEGTYSISIECDTLATPVKQYGIWGNIGGEPFVFDLTESGTMVISGMLGLANENYVGNFDFQPAQ